MIEYIEKPSKILLVKCDGKRVGTIRPVDGGWKYFPLNSKEGGLVYSSIKLVQKSLEFEDV
jgi:hypothetical protein